MGLAGSDSVPLGLLQGGQAITKCKDRFKQLLDLLVKIASLQVCLYADNLCRHPLSRLMRLLRSQAEE